MTPPLLRVLFGPSVQFSYYVCGTLTKNGAGSCPSHYLNARRLESLVVDKIKAVVLTRENLTRLAEYVTTELNSSSESHQEELETVENEISEVNGRLQRVYDAIETARFRSITSHLASAT